MKKKICLILPLLCVFCQFLVSHAIEDHPEYVYEMSNDTNVIYRDRNTRLVIFGMKRGRTNPWQFLKEVVGDWGFEGEGELTSVGV